MTDLANIRDALNLYYYGQTVPTVSPVAGLAKEFGDITVLLSGLQTTLDNRKPPKIIAQATVPPSPITADTVGGLWIDTDGTTIDPSATLAYYWNATTSAWEPLRGKVLESYPYVWTGAQTFKSTFNYFSTTALRDAAFPTPVEGQLVVLDSRLQVFDTTWKFVTPPTGGTVKQAALKASSSDFDVAWADVVTPTGSHTFSGANSFTGSTSFTVAPSMVGVTVSGTATVATLNVSGVTGLNTLNVSGTFTQSGVANLNGKTIAANSTVRDVGFFLGTRRVYISATQPTTGVAGDIWIQG
jgi:hypothetical protein